MNRKTNLFYSNGQDNNFVTFSNYTEALTGNILSTNTKLFPSKFICMYIPSLDLPNENEPGDDEDTPTPFDLEKTHFIKTFLCGYYENKLAFLRDVCVNENVDVETTVNPLDYLINCILEYDAEAKITFIDNICEQEYNGVFMDNICIIENNALGHDYDIYVRPDVEPQEYVYEDGNDEYLYGWSVPVENHDTHQMERQYIGPESYRAITPKFDGENDGHYFYDSSARLQVDELEDTLPTIKFNVLIPLFNIHSNYLSNVENKEDMPDDILIMNNSDYNNQYDIPMGIWFSDSAIELNRVNLAAKTYRPSWSICISSQFKPFPYSDKYPNEIEEYRNPDKFATFALIMSKQGFIIDEFNKITNSIVNIENQINNGGGGGGSGTPVDLTEILNRLSVLENSVSEIRNFLDNYEAWRTYQANNENDN